MDVIFLVKTYFQFVVILLFPVLTYSQNIVEIDTNSIYEKEGSFFFKENDQPLHGTYRIQHFVPKHLANKNYSNASFEGQFKKKGGLNGRYEIYSGTGILYEKGTLKNGSRVGNIETFYISGEKKTTDVYRYEKSLGKGIPVGPKTSYTTDGKISSVHLYDGYGNITKSTEYNKGKLHSEDHYSYNSDMVGHKRIIHYDESKTTEDYTLKKGETLLESKRMVFGKIHHYYKFDPKTGVSISENYHENGQVSSRSTINKSLKKERYEKFSENGKPISNTEKVNDTIIGHHFALNDDGSFRYDEHYTSKGVPYGTHYRFNGAEVYHYDRGGQLLKMEQIRIIEGEEHIYVTNFKNGKRQSQHVYVEKKLVRKYPIVDDKINGVVQAFSTSEGFWELKVPFKDDIIDGNIEVNFKGESVLLKVEEKEGLRDFTVGEMTSTKHKEMSWHYLLLFEERATLENPLGIGNASDIIDLGQLKQESRNINNSK